MSKFTYNYTVVSNDTLFANDLPTRDLARAELREIKALGYKDARIVREEFILVSTKQVR